MKKFTLLFAILMVIGDLAKTQEIVVAGWTFPGSSALSDTGVSVNIDREITTLGGTSDIEFKNGLTSKAAQASGWDNGVDMKAWVVQLSTENYENLTISSVQQSGGNDPGPKYYKLQYSIEANVWVDVPDGSITVENDWTTSAVESLPLPTACNDVASLEIRWVMVSTEASGNGGTVLETGKNKIDDIYILGEIINGVNDIANHSAFTIYPNPTSGMIGVIAESNIEMIRFISLNGQLVKSLKLNNNFINIDLSDLKKGTYLVQTKFKGEELLHTDKVMVR